MPLSVIKDLVTTPIELTEGTDVTNILKVTKIETDEPGERTPGKKQHPVDAWFCNHFAVYRRYIRPILYRKESTGLPVGIPMTDETRIQALWHRVSPLFELNKKWYITTKIDGQSATYYYKKGWFCDFFGIYSRECKKKVGDNSNWDQMATKYKIKEALKNFGGNIWIQGEIAGPGIQKNKNRLTEKRLFIFNVYMINQKRFMTPHEMLSFCNKYNLEMVPMSFPKLEMRENTVLELSSGISLAGKSIDDLVAMSNGPSEWSKDDLREGIVIREMEDYGLNRISFKVISPEFCIKYGV